MPAESIPRCPFGSNGDLGSSRLEEQLDGKSTRSHAHSKEDLYWLGRGTFARNWQPQCRLWVKTGGPDSVILFPVHPRLRTCRQ